jgi:hypothetical protein
MASILPTRSTTICVLVRSYGCLVYRPIGVARLWYGKVADKTPNTGRLYHHLAILWRPYTLQQLSLYTRSLTCIMPFESSKVSTMTLFSPILEGKESTYYRASSMETIFIKAHALLFTGGSNLAHNECIQQLYNGVFDNYIGCVTAKFEFKEPGVFAALSNIYSLFEYGALAVDGTSRSTLWLAFEESRSRKEGATASHELTARYHPTRRCASLRSGPATVALRIGVASSFAVILSLAQKIWTPSCVYRAPRRESTNPGSVRFIMGSAVISSRGEALLGSTAWHARRPPWSMAFVKTASMHGLASGLLLTNHDNGSICLATCPSQADYLRTPKHICCGSLANGQPRCLLLPPKR